MAGIGLHLFDLAFISPESIAIELPNGLSAFEDWEALTAGANPNGTTGGAGFSGAWRCAAGSFGLLAYDSLETYAVGGGVDGLTDGEGFAGNWVSR